jgi:phage terminase large subunit-like protein
VVNRQCRRQARSSGQPLPDKARPEQKIDAAVALIMAVGRSLVEPEQFTSICERAELWPA